MDVKGEIDSNTVLERDFNTQLTSVARSYRQKISKETVALNDTLDEMDLTDIFTAFHPKASEYKFFSSAHGILSRTDHTSVHKTRLNKF